MSGTWLTRAGLIGIVCLWLTACATPGGVASSLDLLDDAYKDNARLMRQYRQLVIALNERYALWYGYVSRRSLLDTALLWITTDPVAADSPDMASARAGITRDAILGPDLVAVVNELRLSGLPARAVDGTNVFEPGRGDMTTLIQNLPRLVAEIDKRVASQTRDRFSFDYDGFDAYATNVQAMRQVNDVLRAYLKLDVGIGRDDIDEISDALRELR